MPRLKKNVAPLLERATDSLTLSIELFNRPAETGRSHGVLILLQHSFEMLLKAFVGKIRMYLNKNMQDFLLLTT